MATRAGTFYFVFELVNSEQAVLCRAVIADKFVGSGSNPRAPAASHRRVDMFPQPFPEPRVTAHGFRIRRGASPPKARHWHLTLLPGPGFRSPGKFIVKRKGEDVEECRLWRFVR